MINRGLLAFPTDWDSLVYHIPLVDGWLQASSLYVPDLSLWSFPGNAELVGLWMVGPFTGDFPIALTNLPATILLAASLIALGEQIGLTGWCRHAPAIVVVFSEVVARQLTTQRNDIPVAALCCAALYHGLRYIEKGTGVDVVFWSISLGLLVGVKFFSPAYAAVVWGSVLCATICRYGSCRALHIATVSVVGVLLWGGYWYIRNTVVTGSPFYPYTTASNTMRELYPVPLWTTSFVGSPTAELLPLFVSAIWRVGGPALCVAFLALPISVAGLLGSGVRRVYLDRGNVEGLSRLVVAACLLGGVVVVAITPAMVEDQPGTLNVIREGYGSVRYAFAFLSVAALALK